MTNLRKMHREKEDKKFFLIGSFGKRNIGDDLICLSLVETLKNMCKSEILLYISAKEQYFKQTLSSLTSENIKIRFVNSFVGLLKAFANSKFIVIGGGDYIGDYGHLLIRFRGYIKMMLLTFLTKLFFKKLLLINNGFWIVTRSGLAFLKIILNLTHRVSVRDRLSYNLIKSFTGRKLVKGFDTAVLLGSWGRYFKCSSKNNVSNGSIRNIGLSITPVFYNSFLNAKKDEILAEVIAKDINEILSNIKNINLHFVAFNTHPKVGDLKIIRKVMSMIDTNHLGRIRLIANTGTISNFLSKFLHLDAMICCKYHSIILSYLFEKPMIVIGYHPKNEALVYEIGLSEKAYLSLEDVLQGRIRCRLLELLNYPDQFRAKLPVSEAKRRSFDGILSCINTLKK